MIFTHDIEKSLAVLVELLNTGAGGESLHTVEDLVAFIRRNTITEVAPLDPSDVAGVHEVRARLRAIFETTDDREAARLINALTGGATVTPRLSDHDGYGWHVHYFAPGARLAEHLAVDLGMALAHVVVAGEITRLQVCAAPDCENALVDVSRNRSKRYCDSRTCGNRLHVAAYRQRLRAAGVTTAAPTSHGPGRGSARADRLRPPEGNAGR